jgi:hypothetical protein
VGLSNFPNRRGFPLGPFPLQPVYTATLSGTTMDAAGESYAAIGRIHLTSGPGTSKTLSSSGGAIAWNSGAVTFGNAGTTLRIGINDVGATGLEDGTWTSEPFADLVGGTDTITANSLQVTPIETGSRSITHGDLIAVVFELQSRVSDSIVVGYPSVSTLMPYGTADTGSGPAKLTLPPMVTILFDDGTLGWFGMDSYAFRIPSVGAFGSSSTPDEYGLLFQVPVEMTITALFAQVGSIASTDDFELLLYSDPLGTPVAERTVTVDADLVSTGLYFEGGIADFTLAAATNYVIAVRPTTTNTITIGKIALPGAAYRACMPFGTTTSQVSRTDNTGAFGSADTALLPLFGVWVSAIHDGTGGGGGAAQLVNSGALVG